MRHRQLGKSELTVSEVGFGTSPSRLDHVDRYAMPSESSL